MKVLIVTGQYLKSMRSFIEEQIEGVTGINKDVHFDVFDIHSEQNKLNYILKSLELSRTVEEGCYDIVHYHYGLSALPALIKKLKVKQVATFHGSDVYDLHHRVISKCVYKVCDYSVFVNAEQVRLMKPKNSKYEIIPCGIKSELFIRLNRNECRAKMGFKDNEKYILFPGSKNNKVKNYPLLEKAYNLLEKSKYKIVELKDFERAEVPVVMNACDVVVMTSFHEGSPQVIKEAAFSGRPIVTVNVGDVEDILYGSDNSYIISNREPLSLAKAIRKACEKEFNDGFIQLEKYDNDKISVKIMSVYSKILSS